MRGTAGEAEGTLQREAFGALLPANPLEESLGSGFYNLLGFMGSFDHVIGSAQGVESTEVCALTNSTKETRNVKPTELLPQLEEMCNLFSSPAPSPRLLTHVACLYSPSSQKRWHVL